MKNFYDDINWNKIKNENYSALEKFLFWLQKNNKIKLDSAYILGYVFNEFMYQKNICYCDLELFFWENYNIKLYDMIYEKISKNNNISYRKYKDIKIHIIYKAFEIIQNIIIQEM
jgi:hypothetical protein